MLLFMSHGISSPHHSQTIRRLYQHLRASKEAAVERSLPARHSHAPEMGGPMGDLDAELDEGAKVRGYGE